MNYEIGKEYTFNSKEFTASKETGRLYFIIGEKDGTTYKIPPFDFQINSIPEQLVCIYKENDRFEQSLASVLDIVYRVGEIYEFKVFRPNPTAMTLRDEASGLTHNRIVLPQARVNRYDKILCRVTGITSAGLQLEYISSNNIRQHKFFTPSDVASLEYLRGSKWMRVMDRILRSTAMSETAEAIKAGESEWCAIGAESLMRYMPQWISAAPRRKIWIRRFSEVVRCVMESDKFISSFPARSGRGYKNRERLISVMRQLESFSEAAELVAGGNAEEMIEHTLQTMRESGWIYRPVERMSVMMGILSIAPRYSHSHIGEIFEVIKTRRSNKKFIDLFGESFIEMLRSYIENQRGQLNPADRASLRELAEAIAIELLLSAGEEFTLYDRHRGLLYVISALITDSADGRAATMALRTFSGLNDTPLEFDWDDLSEINRVCHHLLAMGPVPAASGTAIFEGENVRVFISDKRLTIAPAWIDTMVKPVFRRKIGGEIQFLLRHPNRLLQRADETDTNLTHHHLLWNEIASCLDNDPVKQRRHRQQTPEVGSTAEIIVTGISPDNRYDFECRILADENNTTGLMPLREIVPYPVGISSHKAIFHDDGKPLVFEAEVTGILPDGRPSLSMARKVRGINASDAREDLDGETEVLAKITDVRGKQYKGTSEYGYGLLIDKGGEPLELNDTVFVKIYNVNHLADAGLLYVNARFVRHADEEEAEEMDYRDFDRGCLHDLLKNMALRTAGPAESADEEMDSDSLSLDEASYISSDALADIALLVEQCAQIRRSDLVGCYTDLAAARILSEAAGDRIRSHSVGLKMRLQEKISLFAKDGRIDFEQTCGLIEECRASKIINHDMASKMKIVGILAGLDNQAFLDKTVDRAAVAGDEMLSRLLALATAHNLLEGLGVASIRAGIKKEIFSLLSLPEPSLDNNRLTVSEDLYHEFKTSLVYPADNGMRPDEKRQGEVIVRTIAAFLNAEGGTLYLGVDNGGYPKGIGPDFRYLSHGAEKYDIREIQDKYNLLLQSNLRRLIGVTVDGLSLFPDYLRIEYEPIGEAWICRVVVNPFPGTVPFKDGRVFIRKEGENNEITDPKERKRFIERRRQ